MALTVSTFPPSAADDCEAILRALPKWFGIEEAIVDYRREIEKNPTIGAFDDDKLVGFLTLKHHNRFSSEIYVMGVLEEYHRRGIGRALVEHAEEELRTLGVEYFQVKTLGPSRENEEYARTRKFYEALGFRALEETNLWGETNPCLMMVKRL